MTGFVGEFWLAGDQGFYDAATSRIFNHRLPDRRPAAVLRAAHTGDVVAGVRMAAREGWRIAVRSGGHSWEAWSLREDALLIDLARFTGLSYDPSTMTVAVGPAVRGGLDLDPYLAHHGRFFPVGHAPTVGIGGFLLQGGIGWNCRSWGWAAEAIDSMDVVDASGELLRCSPTENADLFWAARGSGPGFCGVVTEFRLRTRPRFKQLLRSTYAYPTDLAPEVLDWYLTARHEVPPSVELAAVASTFPESDEPMVCIDAVAFDGGPTALAVLGSYPVVERSVTRTAARPVELVDLFSEQSLANPDGYRYLTDNAFLAGTRADLVPALLPAFTDLPTPRSFTVLGDFSPHASRPAPDMAVSLPSDMYFAAYMISEDAHDDGRCRSWLNTIMGRVAPHSAGCYLGDSDLTVRPDRIMSDTAWERLQEVRAARDPKHRFVGYLGTPMNGRAEPKHTDESAAYAEPSTSRSR